MLISVDLPAPFSPMMPVIDPAATASDTPRLARIRPNDLSIPFSSMAAGRFVATGFRLRSGAISPPRWNGSEIRANPERIPPSACRQLVQYDRDALEGSVGSLAVAHEIMHRDPAADDVGLDLIDLGLHLRRDQLRVVL